MDNFKKFLWRLSIIPFVITLVIGCWIEGIIFIISGKPLHKVFPIIETMYDNWADKIFKQ